MKILVCKPRGFCAGVERAIECVRRALDKFGYQVVRGSLSKRGARAMREMHEVLEQWKIVDRTAALAALNETPVTAEEREEFAVLPMQDGFGGRDPVGHFSEVIFMC